MDEDSTGGMVIPPGISAHGRGMYQKNGYPPGIISSVTKNPPEV
jgi:hypothetical protein